MKKLEKQNAEVRLKVSLALSRFTAELLGRPNEYKSQLGGANFYPSDCLYHWGFQHIDKDGAIIEHPEREPMNVAGITCGGCVTMDSPVKVLTIWFDNLK